MSLAVSRVGEPDDDEPAGRAGGTGREIEGAILLSPPLHRTTDADLDRWAASESS